MNTFDGQLKACTRQKKQSAKVPKHDIEKKLSRAWHDIRARASIRENLGRLRNFMRIENAANMSFLASDQIAKKNDSEFIGIAEGGARTRDLEVVIYRNDKSHTLYRLSYPGRSDDQVV